MRTGKSGKMVTAKLDGMSAMHRIEREFRQRLLCETLTTYEGNRTRAARALGIQRTYLLRLLRELDLRDRVRRGPGSVRATGVYASSEASETKKRPM